MNFSLFPLSSFNSRTPGGVRRGVRDKHTSLIVFQFTHPGRGATRADVHHFEHPARFNSRTPGGVRLKRVMGGKKTISFNSRTPGGVRPEHQLT